jgi:hypothetical protein
MNSDRDDQRRSTDKFLLPYSLESRSCFRKPLYYQHVSLPATFMLMRYPQVGRPSPRLDGLGNHRIFLPVFSLL